MIYLNNVIESVKNFIFKQDFSFKNKKNIPKVLFFIPTQTFLNFRDSSSESITVKNAITESMYSEIENQFNSFLNFNENINSIKNISQKKEKDFVMLRNSFLSGIKQRNETLENISLEKRIYDIIENKENDFFGAVTKNVFEELEKDDTSKRKFLFSGNEDSIIYSKDFRPISRSRFNIDHEIFNYLTGFKINEIENLDEHSFIIKSFLDFARNMYTFDTAISNENFKPIVYNQKNNLFSIGDNDVLETEDNDTVFDFFTDDEYFDYTKIVNPAVQSYVNNSTTTQPSTITSQYTRGFVGVDLNAGVFELSQLQLSQENKEYIESISNNNIFNHLSFEKFIELVIDVFNLKINSLEDLYIVSNYTYKVFNGTDSRRHAEIKNLKFFSNIFNENIDFFKLDFNDYKQVNNSTNISFETGTIFDNSENKNLDKTGEYIKRFYDAKIAYHISKPHVNLYYDFKTLYKTSDDRFLYYKEDLDQIIKQIETQEETDVSFRGDVQNRYELETINYVNFDRFKIFYIIDLLVKKTKLKFIKDKGISLNFVKEIIDNIKKRKNSKEMIPYLVNDFRDLSVVNKDNEIFKFLFTLSDSESVFSNISFKQNRRIHNYNFVSKKQKSEVNKSFIENVTKVMSNYYPQGYFMSSSILYDSIIKDFQIFQERNEIGEKLDLSDVISMCLYFNYIVCLEENNFFTKNKVAELIVKRFIKTAILRNKNKNFNKKTSEFLFDINKWEPVDGFRSDLTIQEAKTISVNRENSSESLKTIQNNVFEKENIANLGKKTANLQSNLITFVNTDAVDTYQVLINNILPFVYVVNPKIIKNDDLSNFFNYDIIVKKDIKFKRKPKTLKKVYRVSEEKTYENIAIRIYTHENQSEKESLLEDTLTIYDENSEYYNYENSRILEVQDRFDDLFQKSSIFQGIENKIISLINLNDNSFLNNKNLKNESKVDSYISNNNNLIDSVHDLLKAYAFIFIDVIKKINIDTTIKTFKNYQEKMKVKELVRDLSSTEKLNDKYFLSYFYDSMITNSLFTGETKPQISYDSIMDLNKVRREIKERNQTIITERFDSNINITGVNNLEKEIIETYGLLLKSDFRQTFNMDIIRTALLYVEDTQDSSRMLFNQDLDNFIEYFNLSSEVFYNDICDENYVKKIKGLITKQGIKNESNYNLLNSFNTLDNRTELLEKNFFDNILLERKLSHNNILENKSIFCLDCSLKNFSGTNKLILINIIPVDLNDDSKCYLPVSKILSTNLLNIDIDKKNSETYYVDDDLNFINIRNKNDYRLRNYNNISDRIKNVLEDKKTLLSLSKEEIENEGIDDIEDIFLKIIFENHLNSNDIKRAIKSKLNIDLYEYGKVDKELVSSIVNTVNEESFKGITGDINRQDFLDKLNSSSFNFEKEMALCLSSTLSNNILTKEAVENKDNYEMFLIGFEEQNLKFFTLNSPKNNYVEASMSNEEKALLIFSEINPRDLSDDNFKLYTDNSNVPPVLNFYIRVEVI